MPVIEHDELQELIEHPKDANAVIALHHGNRLPECHQVGPTCGIYSLDAALRLRGGWYAPPPRNVGTRDKLSRLINPSAIRIAKMYGRSQAGEIGSCQDIQFLAATMGYARTEIKRFDSADELWALITESAKARRSIVMPYVCLDGGEATSDAKAGFAHWCLVFGRYVRNLMGRPHPNARRALAVTYGKYFQWSVRTLQRSNAAIRDWESQVWVRYPIWLSDPEFEAPDEAHSWQRDSQARNNEWVNLSEAGDYLDMAVEAYNSAGWGIGLGFNKQKDGPARIYARAAKWARQRIFVHAEKWVRHTNAKPSQELNLINQLPGVKQEPLRAVAYSKTMAHMCVVV
jgi:hypothetical protein